MEKTRSMKIIHKLLKITFFLIVITAISTTDTFAYSEYDIGGYNVTVTPDDHSVLVYIPGLENELMSFDLDSNGLLDEINIDDYTKRLVYMENGISYNVTLSIMDYFDYSTIAEGYINATSIFDPDRNSTALFISGVGNLTESNIMEYDYGVTITGSGDFSIINGYFQGISGGTTDVIDNGEYIIYDFPNPVDYLLFNYGYFGNSDLSNPTIIIYEGSTDGILVFNYTYGDERDRIFSGFDPPIDSFKITVVHDGIGYPTLFVDMLNTISNNTAPIITSLVADDPDDLDNIYSVDDTITITFDSDTNTPGGTDRQGKGYVNALFTFTEFIGSTYNGQWVTADTFVITITDTNNAGPLVIGNTTVTPTGTTPILSSNETSTPSYITSPVLSGDFGTTPIIQWILLPLTDGVPSITDCDDIAEYGRVILDAQGSTENTLYLCTASGWIAK